MGPTQEGLYRHTNLTLDDPAPRRRRPSSRVESDAPRDGKTFLIERIGEGHEGWGEDPETLSFPFTFHTTTPDLLSFWYYFTVGRQLLLSINHPVFTQFQISLLYCTKF